MRKIIKSCVFVLALVLVFVGGYLSCMLQPIGCVGEHQIRVSDLNDTLKKAMLYKQRESIIADEIVKRLSLELDENEISVKAYLVPHGDDVTDEEVYDMIKCAVVKQKAIEHYANSFEVSIDSAKAYIQSHPKKYSVQPSYEIVKQDITMEMGEKQYEALVTKLEAELYISLPD